VIRWKLQIAGKIIAGIFEQHWVKMTRIYDKHLFDFTTIQGKKAASDIWAFFGNFFLKLVRERHSWNLVIEW